MATTTADPAILPDGGVAANGITIDAAVESHTLGRDDRIHGY